MQFVATIPEAITFEESTESYIVSTVKLHKDSPIREKCAEQQKLQEVY